MESTPTTFHDDAEVRAAQTRVTSAQTALATAQQALRATCAPVPTGYAPPPDFLRLQLEHAVHEAEAGLTAETTALRRAEEAARRKILDAARPDDEARLRALLAIGEQAHAAATEYQAAREALAARVGLTAGPHPAPSLLGPLAGALATIRRTLAEPAPFMPAPIPAGLRRIRVVERFRDEERRILYPGIEVVTEETAKEAVERGWAVAI